MQYGSPHHRGVEPRGLEAWLPPLFVALASIALVVALIYFVLIAYTLRDRFALPPGMILIAMGVAALLAGYMTLRAIGQIRQSIRALRAGRRDESGRP